MYGKCYTGIYKPENPDKYDGDPTNIVYRSGLELKFFRYVDLNKNILKWGSETIVVPYVGLDGKTHRYFIDLWVRVKTKKGEIKECLCEIKPLEFTKPPKKQKRITKQWKLKYKQWLTNQSKWDSAKKFAKQKGWGWEILTERDLRN